MKTSFHNQSSARRTKHVITWLAIAALVSLAPGAVAADATLSEMLELGIYSEETKGDLAAAIKLYEQIVAEADAGQALAAQAQFRLAICHDKKKDYAAATTAFEKLVREFPQQKELVALANEYLADGAALLPVPWADGEEMQYVVKLPAGTAIGVGRYSVRADTIDGRAIWRFQSQLIAGGQQWSRMEVDAATFKPIHCLWKIALFGEADTIYRAGGADVKLKGKDDVKHIEFDGPVYDNEQAAQLMRRLPYTDGYSTTLTIFTGLGGGNMIPIPLHASGPEPVTVPAGAFDCYKVALKVGPNEQTFWYSADEHRYLVKFEAGGVRVELARVVHVVAGSPVPYQDPVFGFSVTAPAGWMVERKETPDDTKRSTLVMLDAEGTGMTQVKAEAIANFDAATQASVRAFADHQISEGTKYVKSYQVRPDSWTDLTVAGQPAVSCVADVVPPMGPPQVMRGVYAFVDGNAVEFWFMTVPADFEALQPQFDAMVASYHGK